MWQEHWQCGGNRNTTLSCSHATQIQAGINNVYLRVGEGPENYVVIPAKDLVWVQTVEK